MKDGRVQTRIFAWSFARMVRVDGAAGHEVGVQKMPWSSTKASKKDSADGVT